MRKLSISLLLCGLIGSNLFAGWFEGTIHKVERNSNGTTVIRLDTGGGVIPTGVLTLTGDEKKQFMAVILTAKAMKEPIKLFISGGHWLYYSY